MNHERKDAPDKNPKSDWRRVLSSEIDQAERLFVLGVGNRRKGDDAAGSLSVRLLKKGFLQRKRRAGALPAVSGRPLLTSKSGAPLEVIALDAGESPESATRIIRNFRPSHVLIIDAAAGGHQPGTIFVIDKRQISQEEISTHRIPLSQLARYLEESIGCRVILVGIEPEIMAWGKRVSACIAAAAAELAGSLMAIIEGKIPID